MRIGLLEADHVDDRYLPIAGDYSHMFTAMVAEADPSAEVVLYDVRHGTLPERPDECDAWLCTGSSASVYDDEPWIESLAGFVRAVHEAGVPFVGICFGHQLIAHALGGSTQLAEVGWGVGALPMQVVEDVAWMTPPLPSATLLYSHQDQVIDLPPGSTILAAAPHCPVAMFAVGEDIVGVQAHPEFSAGYLRALLDDRVDRIGEAGTAAALESLEQPTDERAVARWILAFLRAPRRADVPLTASNIGARFEGSDPSTGRMLARDLGAPTTTHRRGSYGCTLVLRAWSALRPAEALAGAGVDVPGGPAHCMQHASTAASAGPANGLDRSPASVDEAGPRWRRMVTSVPFTGASSRPG